VYASVLVFVRLQIQQVPCTGRLTSVESALYSVSISWCHTGPSDVAAAACFPSPVAGIPAMAMLRGREQNGLKRAGGGGKKQRVLPMCVLANSTPQNTLTPEAPGDNAIGCSLASG